MYVSTVDGVEFEAGSKVSECGCMHEDETDAANEVWVVVSHLVVVAAMAGCTIT